MVVVQILRIRVDRFGMTLELSDSWDNLWAYVPGRVLRRMTVFNPKKITLMNYYNVAKVVEILKNLPLVNPDEYQFDPDNTYTDIRYWMAFKQRGIIPGEVQDPTAKFRKYTKYYPRRGDYVKGMIINRNRSKVND